MTTPTVGLLGARSPVGDAVVLALAGSATVVRFSREQRPPDDEGTWRVLGAPDPPETPVVISLMPVWAVPEHVSELEALGCRRLVALSSTSRFTKHGSSRPDDRALAERLRRGEEATAAWARDADVDLVVVRTTMIYGHDRDGNVAAMRRVLRRFRVVPVVGRGTGRRQPVHVLDVGGAVARLALRPLAGTGRAEYTLSGGEVLSYRAMVDRVRATVPGPTLVVRVPESVFRWAEKALPRSRAVHTAAGMADRMNTDMVFDHGPATTDLGFSPRGFDPGGS